MLTNRGYLSLLIIAILIAMPLTGLVTPAQAHSSASPAPPSDLLQFTAGQHVLGFQPNRVYLVGMPQVLRVEFVDTAGVTPVADGSDLTASQNLSGLSRSAPPLSQVTYSNLWDGVSLTYAATADGLAKSTYLVVPYADADQIRLQYNMPVELLADGSLQFTPQWGPAGGDIYFNESAPIAWQDIKGQRIPVEVSFQLSEETKIVNRKSQIVNRVGFRLGRYNPAYPLLIDRNYSATGYGLLIG